MEKQTKNDKKSPLGKGFFGEEPAGIQGSILAQSYVVPPFSVYDSKGGTWRSRKRAWLKLGIQSELGRAGASARTGGSHRPACDYSKSGDRGDGIGKAMGRPKKTLMRSCTCAQGWVQRGPDAGGSIFDPVLCEALYKQFCPPGGTILDPFAGGSVRGIVASLLGYSYVGIELRRDQLEANVVQANEICIDKKPQWVEGDAKDIEELYDGRADFIFSCPPYADLERYSNDPRDLSTLPYTEFLRSYGQIIKATAKHLRQNRFACFVVANIRNSKTGAVRNLVGDTIEAFERAGLVFWNDAIFLTAIGSLPVRTSHVFPSQRKLGKTHQNVLVFCNGDARKASEAIGKEQ